MCGFMELVDLFAWREDYVGGDLIKLPPEATTYKAVIDIVKRMRDGIAPEHNGPLTKDEIKRA